MPNTQLMTAAALTGLTAAVHMFAGGPEYHPVIRNLLETTEYKALYSVLWHAVSVFLIVSTLATGWMSLRPNLPLALTIGGIQLGWAGLFIAYGLGDLGTLWTLPQWVIFIAIPSLLLWGHKRR